MGFEMKCVPVLDRMPCCCCSCDVKIATCILGWLDLTACVGSFLRGTIGLAMLQDSEDVQPEDSEAILIATVISSAIGILFTSLLLYGAHNKKPGFMLPRVIFHMICIVITAVAVVGLGIWLFFVNVIAGLCVLVIGGLFVALSSFFWVVTYSYYRQLEEQGHPLPASHLVNDFTG